jgi:hypothetical protein
LNFNEHSSHLHYRFQGSIDAIAAGNGGSGGKPEAAVGGGPRC